MGTGDLGHELERSGAVVYASSTVGLEAASQGIPTICIDPGKALDMDPMGSWNEFKWTVSNTQNLTDTLGEIDGLSPKNFAEGSDRARQFPSEYLKPVTDEGVRKFLKASA